MHTLVISLSIDLGQRREDASSILCAVHVVMVTQPSHNIHIHIGPFYIKLKLEMCPNKSWIL